MVAGAIAFQCLLWGSKNWHRLRPLMCGFLGGRCIFEPSLSRCSFSPCLQLADDPTRRSWLTRRTGCCYPFLCSFALLGRSHYHVQVPELASAMAQQIAEDDGPDLTSPCAEWGLLPIGGRMRHNRIVVAADYRERCSLCQSGYIR